MIVINPIESVHNQSKRLLREINALLPGPLESILPALERYKAGDIKPQSANTTFYEIKRDIVIQLGIRYDLEPMVQWEVNKFFERLISRRVRTVKKPPPNEQEMAIILACPGLKASLFFEFYYRTGIRVTESTWIKVSDVFTNGQEYAILISHGKGGHERVVPVESELIQRVRAVFRGRAFLFENVSGKRYTRQSIYNLMAKTSKKLIGRPAGPHLMRHGTATYLVGNYPDKLVAICEALGWSSIQMAMTYTHQQLHAAHMPIIGQVSGGRQRPLTLADYKRAQ